MSTDGVNNSTGDDSGSDNPQSDWMLEVFNRLRNDLIPEINDDTIHEAIERYRRFVLEHMLKTGEIERVGSNSQISYTIWHMTDDPPKRLIQKLIELDELEVGIPLPNDELYNDIITGIWKQVVQDPTWSVEFSLGSKSIKRDKRNKVDSNGLLLQEHALIYFYANDFGCFDHCNSDREKIETYIQRHKLSTSYKSFNKLLSNLLRVQERLESGFWEKTFPFLQEWYGLAYTAALRDHERYFQTLDNKKIKKSTDAL